MYFHGMGVDQDYKAALEWYQKSAEQGYGEAQACLGHMYEKGLGVDRDIQKALELFVKSAEQGNALGQVRLGNLYLNGLGVDQNPWKAFAWYQKSAEQGNDEAQACLGHMYEKGLGVDRDIQKALELYKKSAAQDNTVGQVRLGDLYLAGLGVDQNFRKAFACYQKSAEQGNDPENTGLAQLRLGAMYCQGKGIEKDFKKGFECYKKSAELGNAEAQLCLGAMYRDGMGVARDHKKALEWFQKSARKSKAPADSAMGDIYRDGLVVEKNIPEAMKWYKKAAQNGDKYAKTELLKLQQEESAQKKFKTGSAPASKGDSQAMTKTADTHPFGMVVEKKEEKAQEQFNKAVEKGDVPVRGKLQQVQQPKSTKLQTENKIPEITGQKPAPSQNKKTKKAHAPRTLIYLFSAIGMIGLSLMVIWLNLKKTPDRTLGIVEPTAMEIVPPPPFDLPSVPPGVLELPREILKKINARKSSAKQNDKSSLPIEEARPAAIKIEPVVFLLRHECKALDEGEVSEMLKAKNIFDAERNPGGDFQHEYTTNNVAGLLLIFDRATNLVWTQQQNSVKMNLLKSMQWIESLNNVGYGGVGKWRLPSVEEAASLLKKNTDDGKLFLDAVFGGDIKVIWTGDSFKGSESWVVDFQKGMIKHEKNKSRLMTLMVSSDPDSFSKQIPIQRTPATDD